ncbi:MAG: SpoIIE family protein phosphatase [Polyangiaceae bacterium]|nr:SpoIIE family protein phosphatase [Polyangiaceae bacterium]
MSDPLVPLRPPSPALPLSSGSGTAASTSLRPFPVLAPRLWAQSIAVGPSLGSARTYAIADAQGGWSVIMVDALGRANPEPLLSAAEPVLVSALGQCAPLHEVVNKLKDVLFQRGVGPLALGVLRIDPSEQKLEILNAGLPHIGCVDNTGAISLEPALSNPVGLLPDEHHSYKLTSLTADTTLCVFSEGVLQGSRARSLPRDLVSELHLERWGGRLCSAPIDESSRLVSGALWRSHLSPEEGVCLFVHLPGPPRDSLDPASTRPPKKSSPRP